MTGLHVPAPRNNTISAISGRLARGSSTGIVNSSAPPPVHVQRSRLGRCLYFLGTIGAPLSRRSSDLNLRRVQWMTYELQNFQSWNQYRLPSLVKFGQPNILLEFTLVYIHGSFRLSGANLNCVLLFLILLCVSLIPFLYSTDNKLPFHRSNSRK